MMARHRRASRAAVAVLLVLAIHVSGSAAQESLTRDEIAAWMAVGQKCQAPIIRIPGRGGGFDIYIESPAGRAALVAATATMMHESLDAPGVRTAVQRGYRVWLATTGRRPQTVSIHQITIRARGRADLHPIRVRDELLALGTVPSHGIVEPLRVRSPEFVFSDLPRDDFFVVLHLSAGTERYRVASQDRSRVIRVCN